MKKLLIIIIVIIILPTDACDILSRLLLEVKHVLGKEDGEAKKEEKDEDAPDVRTLQVLLLGATEAVLKGKQKRVVVVLDGLDRSLKAGKTSKVLNRRCSQKTRE